MDSYKGHWLITNEPRADPKERVQRTKPTLQPISKFDDKEAQKL